MLKSSSSDILALVGFALVPERQPHVVRTAARHETACNHGSDVTVGGRHLDYLSVQPILAQLYGLTRNTYAG